MKGMVGLVFACACGHLGDPSPEAFGLTDAPRDRTLVKKVVETANEVLGAGALQFRIGWGPIRPATVPVYAVGDDGMGRLEIMTTYDECRCVVVQAGALAAWLAESHGKREALVTIEPDDVLAYMLLHEMGHIRNGDHGAWDAPASSAPVPNLAATRDKDAEVAADRFAAVAVKTAQAVSSTRAVTASMLAVAIATLSWNLQAHRALDDFGGTTLRKRQLFWDKGLTHPNLEWRILVVNDLIENTARTHQLVLDFEAGRQPSAQRLGSP